MFRIEYDENLPKYYNANHKFLWERMNKKVLNDSKLFEKIEIQWFSIEDMKKRKNEFRMFYQEIVDQFLGDLEKITQFIKTRSMNNNRKTRRSK
jgi:hypothetical protein